MTKDELLEQAMTWADVCRSFVERWGLGKFSPLPEFVQFVQDLARLKGFCEALYCLKVFDEDDVKGIWTFAFPGFRSNRREASSESSKAAPLSAVVVRFINGLDALDQM